jgi:hypothetical protein
MLARTAPIAASMLVARTGTDRPAPEGRNGMEGGGARLFRWRCKAGFPAAGKKPCVGVAGRLAGFVQIKSERGHLGRFMFCKGQDGLVIRCDIYWDTRSDDAYCSAK